MNDRKPKAKLDTREKTPPKVVLTSLWGSVFVLTLYGAPVIKEEVNRSDRLKNTPVATLVAGLEGLGNALGAAAARSAIDAIRQPVQAPFLVLQETVVEEVPPPSPEPPKPEVPVAEAALVHHRPEVKRRVLVIGASSIQFALGVELEHEIPRYTGAKVKRFGKLATGLARPDFFDWPKQTEQLASQFKPDLIIANFGGNCAQDIPVGDQEVKVEDPKWPETYGSRVKEILDIGKKHGAPTVLIGMPNMRDPAFAKKMVLVNSVQKSVAEREGALFVSTWDMTSEKDGSYRETVQMGKKRGLMRTSDGVHFKALGAEFIVENVMQEVERRWVLGTTDKALARSEGHGFESKELGKSVDYVVYIPSVATAEHKVPVELLAHEGKWGVWPTYPHRDLQRTAEATGHLLVSIGLGAEELSKVLSKELMLDLGAHLPADTSKVRVFGSKALVEKSTGLDVQPMPPEKNFEQGLKSALTKP